jgi:ribosomal protein L9
LKAAGHDVERRRIEVPEHIKQLGSYDVTVKYYGGVTATVKVWVVRA